LTSESILIVEDDPDTRRSIECELSTLGKQCVSANNGATARAAMQETAPSLCLLDLGLPDISGTELLEEFRRNYPETEVIVVTAQNDAEVAVKCIRLGATDFLLKPYDSPRFVKTVRRALERRRLTAAADGVAALARRSKQGLDSLIGSSPSMGRTKALVRKVISANVTVLLSGESGTGKEVLARAIHAESQRSRNPFLAINCGAIPENLIESELFGHARGAFTGASKSRAGLFEQAEGGSLFLDEIGELRLDLQVKLLRVLQDRCVRRLGCEKERSLDVRVIAATNLQLQDEVAAGRFRNDLYYRLSIFPVELPSLRERSVDILELAHYFLKKHGVRLGARASGFTPAAERALLSYHWPGNVRELENAIERAMLLAETDLVDLSNLPGRLGGQTPGAWPTGYGDPSDTLFSSVESSQIATLAAEERRILTRALEITGGNVKEAAKRLEIGRATLYRKIRAYSLALPKKSQAQ